MTGDQPEPISSETRGYLHFNSRIMLVLECYSTHLQRYKLSWKVFSIEVNSQILLVLLSFKVSTLFKNIFWQIHLLTTSHILNYMSRVDLYLNKVIKLTHAKIIGMLLKINICIILVNRDNTMMILSKTNTILKFNKLGLISAIRKSLISGWREFHLMRGKERYLERWMDIS